MSHSPQDRAGPGADPSTGQLVTRLSEQVSRLVRDELALAQMELASNGKKVGVGAALLAVAGVLAFYGVGAALVAAGIALALVFAGWLAALIVTGGIFLLAGLVAVIGKSRLSKGTPLASKNRPDSIKADLAAIKQGRSR